ncbi:hypothetical protein HMPREF9374_2582 [Desmospora sp. 8437]|nr:hypothetical protein HMPREF9374_2582 [Desmospora sp. 8437]
MRKIGITALLLLVLSGGLIVIGQENMDRAYSGLVGAPFEIIQGKPTDLR